MPGNVRTSDGPAGDDIAMRRMRERAMTVRIVVQCCVLLARGPARPCDAWLNSCRCAGAGGERCHNRLSDAWSSGY